jgi:hypothetical protein
VAEYGLVAPLTLRALRVAIPNWLEDAGNGLTDYFRSLLHGLWSDLVILDDRKLELDRTIQRLADSSEVTRRLQQLRGVGPMVAAALVATVGTGEQYPKGRQMAAALRLTPRQASSGGKNRLLGITKRGDVYLRKLLIHGARAVVTQAKHKDDRLSRWVTSIATRRHPNVAAVALAKWPGINVCQLKRPDIRLQSCHVCYQQFACNEEESIYGDCWQSEEQFCYQAISGTCSASNFMGD